MAARKEDAEQSIDFTQSEEFKNAVAEAATAAAQLAVEQVLSTLGKEQASVGDDNSQIFQQLAMAIAEVSDQGTNRKRVAPEILSKRTKARELMFKLIDEAAELGEIPQYELIGKVYLDEQLVDPMYRDSNKVVKRTKIEWVGVPNEAMRPINVVADKIFGAFLDSVGSVVKAVPDRELKLTARGLVVMGQEQKANIPNVGGENDISGKLRLLGRREEGEITEVAILGTVAPRARQVA